MLNYHSRLKYQLPELERSLFLEMREVHKKCRSFIWPEGSHAPGRCMNCLIEIGENKYEGVQVPKEEKYQMFFYRLRDGRVFGTTIGIWNMN